jgi:hypothetical protein
VLRILDVYPRTPYPDFYLSRVPDPTTRKEWGKIVVLPFFLLPQISQNGRKILYRYRKNLNNRQSTFQKLTLSSQKYGLGIRDLGFGIKPILDAGVKKAPDPGSGSATMCITYLLGLLGG